MSLRPIVFEFIRKAQRLWRGYAWRLSRDLERPLRSCHRVIHVGANIGQERDQYERWGLHVIWVEPNPETYAKLVHNIRNRPRRKALNAVVTDTDGVDRSLQVSNNQGRSSSNFELKLHKEIWPTVGYSRTIRLETVTLATLLRDSGVDLCRFDSLVLDTRGSELLVLRGAESLPRNFRYIKTEAADFEAYERCCLLAEVDAFLEERGFAELDRVAKSALKSGARYYDVVYRRVGSGPLSIV